MAGCGEDDLHLPQEICIEILSRLPVKSILRFRSVCKSWHSLISCPNFKPKTLSDRILVNCEDRSCGVLWSLTSESRDHKDDLPDRFRGQRVGLVGPCDGLICLYDIAFGYGSKKKYINFIIYNPAIRKIIELPSLRFDLNVPSYYGFGFDSKAGDYKVIYIYQVEYRTSYAGFVFDLKNGVWRKFTPTFPNFLGSAHNHQEFYLNDVVYWLGRCETNNNQRVEALLSFNMRDETFQMISMPAELNLIYRLATFGGLIYALTTKNGVLDPGFSVWVMKENGVTESWTKVFTIDLPHDFCKLKLLILRGLEVAEVLYKYDHAEGDKHTAQLMLHNSESGESKCLFSTMKSIYDVVFYKESLVLM